jgi:hypothetical protein
MLSRWLWWDYTRIKSIWYTAVIRRSKKYKLHASGAFSLNWLAMEVGTQTVIAGTRTFDWRTLAYCKFGCVPSGLGVSARVGFVWINPREYHACLSDYAPSTI